MVWQVAKSTKKCAGCERGLDPDEEYFAALFINPPAEGSKAQKDEFGRKDYCLACWANSTNPDGFSEREPGTGKPNAIFSFWKTRMAPARVAKTPRQVLIEFFDNLVQPEFQPPEGDSASLTPEPAERGAAVIPESRDKITYLFALILLRKRIFKIKENITREEQSYLAFERIPDGKVYEVKELTISDEELVSLRDEFSKLFEFEI